MNTLEDFNIEKSATVYGPVWVVTPKNQKNGIYAEIHYVLRADWNLGDLSPGLKDRSMGVHLDVAYGNEPLKSHGSWKGVYRTESMDEAVASLLEDLDRNNQLSNIERATEGAIAEINELLEDFSRSTEGFTHLDVEVIMERLDAAYYDLKLKYAIASKESTNGSE